MRYHLPSSCNGSVLLKNTRDDTLRVAAGIGYKYSSEIWLYATLVFGLIIEKLKLKYIVVKYLPNISACVVHANARLFPCTVSW